MFKSLDRDGSGYLTKSEIQDGSNKELVGMAISPQRIAQMLDVLSKDDDGKVRMII